jgi:hypothetical protein
MRLIFVANHLPHDNQDELAVAHALRQLGHIVYEVPDRGAAEWFRTNKVDAEFILFFKGWPMLARPGYEHIPLVFYYFDMVRSVVDDPTLRARAAHRLAWMRDVVPRCLVGALTDGDYVAHVNAGHELPSMTGKLVHLMQGADERVMGPGERSTIGRPPLLFMGMIRHGMKRASHIAELKARYGERLEILGDGGPLRRLHGRALANYMAGRIVIAPDGPSTDLYFSNRLYLTLGFGGFLLHPYSAMAAVHYADRKEVVFYRDRQECNDLIDYYLERPAERAAIAAAGYKRTKREHLYRHRCAELIRIVEERLHG